MPSNHLVLCHPLLLPSIFPSIRVFSNELLCIRWPQYWSFSFSVSPFNEYLGLTSFKTEKEMATHSSILAWKIPQTEEPGRLQSMGSQRVGHDCATSLSLSFKIHWILKDPVDPLEIQLDLLVSKQLSRVFSSSTIRKHQFFSAQPSLRSNSHIHT